MRPTSVAIIRTYRIVLEVSFFSISRFARAYFYFYFQKCFHLIFKCIIDKFLITFQNVSNYDFDMPLLCIPTFYFQTHFPTFHFQTHFRVFLANPSLGSLWNSIRLIRCLNFRIWILHKTVYKFNVSIRVVNIHNTMNGFLRK